MVLAVVDNGKVAGCRGKQRTGRTKSAAELMQGDRTLGRAKGGAGRISRVPVAAIVQKRSPTH